MLKRYLPIYIASINFLLVSVGLVFLTFFLPNLNLDFTKNKIHTLSPATVSFVKNLPDVVRVTVYATKALPPEIKPLTKNLEVVLKNFEGVNNKRFVVIYKDPSTDESAKTEAAKLGIRTLQFSSVKSDKLELQTGYFGLAINFGGKQEVLPIAGDIANLEYYLVSSIQKMTSDKKTIITVGNGNGELSAAEAGLFYKYLVSEYDVRQVDLNNGTIATDSATVVLPGPKAKYNAKALDNLAKWVESGKGLVAFLGTVSVSDSLSPTKIDSGLGSLLANQGISLENKLIADSDSGIANFSTGSGSYFVRYEYWPKVNVDGISHDNPATSSLSSIIFPWSSPLTLSQGASALVASSNNSWTVPNDIDFTPGQNNPTLEKNKLLGQSVIVAQGAKNKKFLVVGNSDFLKDQFIYNSQQNLALGLNLVDYSSVKNDLLSIRSKQIVSRPLKQIEDSYKPYVKVVAVVLSVVGAIVFFVLALVVRNIQHKKTEEYELKK